MERNIGILPVWVAGILARERQRTISAAWKAATHTAWKAVFHPLSVKFQISNATDCELEQSSKKLDLALGPGPALLRRVQEKDPAPYDGGSSYGAVGFQTTGKSDRSDWVFG